MNKRKIVLLGHQGMLGQMVKSYFREKGYSIVTIASRFNAEKRIEFISEIKKHPEAIVINCIGKIKQKTTDDNELLWANALLPLALNNELPVQQQLIHPSTDCVFSGNTFYAYSANSCPDANDTYGWSKRLGEVALQNRKNTFIFRVSIIGPDNNKDGKGLLSWFLNNKPESELNGFVQHYWNGITTLEWCKIVEQLIVDKELNNKTLLEMGGTQEWYSKYDMLRLFQEKFNTNFIIRKKNTERVDRRLEPTLFSKPLDKQLDELVDYLPMFNVK